VRWAWKSSLIAAVLVLGVLVVLWRQTDRAPDVGPAATSGADQAQPDRARVPEDVPRSPPLRASSQQSVPQTPELAPRAVRPLAQPVEAIDPCTAIEEPELPPDFTTTIVQGITIALPRDLMAGPTDSPLRPLVLAHVVAGALEDAAELTGTPARTHLTVIVYSSTRELHAQPGIPEWATGAYDGAVRLARDPTSEVGVRVPVLRHEIMHAQLHATIGCMPSWFNEGLASYTASDLSLAGLFAMFRDRDPLDPAQLEVRTLGALSKADAPRAYWQSVAMVVYAIDHAEGSTIASAVRRLGELGADPDHRLAAWRRWFAGVDQHAMLDALARHVFGASGNVDELVRGPACCWGIRDFSQLGCRAPTTRASEEPWLDRSRHPVAICRTSW
jgi:hypothetical protein